MPRFAVFSQVRVRPDCNDHDLEFASSVLGCSEDGGSLLLDKPTAQHPAFVKLRPGQALRLDVDDGTRVYSFDSRVKALEGGCPSGFWVRLPEDPGALEIKHQRELIRLPLSIPIVISIPDGEQTTAVRGETLNLSAGGVGVSTASALAVDARVRVRFAFDEQEEPLTCQARVLASDVSKEGRPNAVAKFESRLAFEEIDAQTQEQILRQCYAIQIERRRRNLTSM